MPIAKMTDTNLLFSCDCLSANSVTGVAKATGTIEGVSPTFDNVLGFSPNATSHSINFSTVTDSVNLDAEGQIVFEVTSDGITEFDDSGQHSGSTGSNKSLMYLLSIKDGASANQTMLYLTGSEILSIKMNSVDTPIGRSVHSAAHGSISTICLWWYGEVFGILIDGNDLLSGIRTKPYASNHFSQLIFGALGATSTPFTGFYIRNIRVSDMSPRLSTNTEISSVGYFGDSYVAQGDKGLLAPRYDATFSQIVEAHLQNKNGMRIRTVVAGYGGHTVGDNAVQNLSSFITDFVAKDVAVAAIIAGNNDATEVITGTTTNAAYKIFINKIMFVDYPTNTIRSRCNRIIITTAGSLKQNTSITDVALSSVNASIKALASWWDVNNPTELNRIRIIDLIPLLGDYAGNPNYQGQLDGNNLNRHPSARGHVIIGDAIYKELSLFAR